MAQLIDTSQPTAFEIEQSGRGVSFLLRNVGKLEGLRRDRQILNDFTTRSAAGEDPAQIIASLAEPQFDPGLLGAFQKIIGAFEGGQGTALPQLQARLAETSIQPEPTELQKAQTKSALALAGQRTTGKVPSPAEKTKEQKLRDSDIVLLEREGKKKDKGNPMKIGQVKEARKRLRALPAGTLFEAGSGEVNDTKFRSFVDKLKDKRIVRKKRILGFSDEVFGKEAFDIALEEAINEGLRDGIDPASMEAAFREWWDRQAEEQKGEFDQEFQSTSEFAGATPQAKPSPTPVSTPQDVRPQEIPRPTTQAEFDAIPKGTEFIDTDGTRVRK